MITLIKIYIKDLFRNRTLGIMIILIPVIFYPLIYWGITQFMMLKTGLVEERSVDLYYSISDNSYNSFIDSLDVIRNLDLKFNKSEERSREGIYLDVSDNEGLPYFRVFIDSTSSAQMYIYNDIEEKIFSYYGSQLDDAIENSGMKKDHFEVFNIQLTNIDGKHEGIMKMLSIMIPLLTVISILSSITAASVEITAGHSEDHTSETTLTVPHSRKKIMLSKIITVIIYGLVAGSVNLFFLLFLLVQIFRTTIDSLGQGFSEFDWSVILNFKVIGLTVLSMALLALFISVIFVCAASFSSKRKEGNVSITPFMTLTMYLPFVLIIPAMEPNFIISATPVLNIAFALKLLIEGNYDIMFFTGTAVFSIIWIFLVYRLLIPVMTREDILLGASDKTLIRLIKEKVHIWKKKK